MLNTNCIGSLPSCDLWLRYASRSFTNRSEDMSTRSTSLRKRTKRTGSGYKFKIFVSRLSSSASSARRRSSGVRRERGGGCSDLWIQSINYKPVLHLRILLTWSIYECDLPNLPANLLPHCLLLYATKCQYLLVDQQSFPM
jgi:hypothetical protein